MEAPERRSLSPPTSLAAIAFDDEERARTKRLRAQVRGTAMKCRDPLVITVKSAVKRLNMAAAAARTRTTRSRCGEVAKRTEVAGKVGRYVVEEVVV